MSLASVSRSTASLGLVAILALSLWACGSNGGSESRSTSASSPSEFPSADGETIDDILRQTNPSELVILPAATVFELGNNRYPFGVFEIDQTPVDEADIALYFAKTPHSRVQGPLPARIDSLSTKPAFRSMGSDGPGEVSSVYVVNPVKFDRAGPWLGIAVIKTESGFSATRLQSPVVGQSPSVASVGDMAPNIRTLTPEDVGGDLTKIDTRQPASTMHDLDFRQVRGKKSVALVFATPALCQSRVCGPVVDVAEQVKSEFGDDVVFIHQEVFKDNDMSQGVRPQLTAFGLETEPWIFLIDRNGRIRKRIEGAIGVDELRKEVQHLAGSNLK